jgi:hypothetical protein
LPKPPLIVSSQKHSFAFLRQELNMREIPFGDLPLYSYYYDANYPQNAREFKAASLP